MAGNPLHTVLDHLRRLHRVADSPQRSDRELLRAFATDNDQDAFALVVTRHALLVWGVCRRILGHHHDAEDAFQATFLILARRARSVRWQSSVGGWLHTVAQRLAVRARKQAQQRRIQERQASQTSPGDASLRELAAVVDEELRHLPAKYREPLLLHYLEGATVETAARQLGLSRAAFYNRLTRGREILRERLNRQGLSLAAPLLAAALTAEAMSASPSLINATMQVARGTVPERVAALAAGVLSVTAMMKLKVTMALGLLLGVAAGGVAMLTPGASMSPLPQAERPAELSRAEDKARVSVDRYGDPLPPGAVARLGTLRFRCDLGAHVYELVIAPDGKMIAVSTIGGVWLFDAATGKQMKRIHPPSSSFWQIAFSPDGKALLTAANSQKPIPVKNGIKFKTWVQIWDVANGRKTTEVELEDVLRLGWPAQAQPLVAWQEKDAIILQEIATGRKRRFSAKDLAGSIRSTCATGKTILATAGNRKSIIHVWDRARGEERWTLKTQRIFTSSHSLVLSADERWLASVTSDAAADKKTVQLWDLTTGAGKIIAAADQPRLQSTAFTPDGKILATIGQQSVRFWDTASGSECGRLKEEGRSFNPSTVSFAPDGKTLATMESLCGAIQLWDVATGELKPGPEGHSTNWVQSASFSPDGKHLTTSGGMDGTVRVWNATTGQQLLRIHRPDPNYASACAFSADGRTLYSCWNDQLLLSDAATGRELQVLKCQNMAMHLSSDLRTAIALRSAYNPNGRGRAAGGARRNDSGGWIGGWDTTTGKQRFHRSLAYQSSERNLVISPDAKMLAVPSVKQQPMHLEDVETGELLLTFPLLKRQSSPLAFSPDGRMLLSHTSAPEPPPAPGGFKRTLRLWEVLTANELLALPVSNNLFSQAAFSPDGRLLATIAPEGEILLWDLRRGKELHRFKGVDSSVTSLTFSPDSSRLVSGLGNSTLLVWDVPQPDTTPVVKLGAEVVAKAWDDLASADAPCAFRARWLLASAPEEAVSFLQEHLHPAKAADPQHLRRLLADLDSEQFAVREKAQKELEKLGDLVESALRQTLANNPSLEMRQRVQAILERSRGSVTQPELLQALRAVAVLEDIDTSKARQILKQLANGAPQSRITREAKASLERMERRSAIKRREK